MQHSIYIADRFLQLGSLDQKEFTVQALLKLVYIAHGWMLGVYGERLIFEDVEAWEHGSVITNLYKEVKHYRDQPDATLNIQSKVIFSPEENNMIKQVYSNYSSFSGLELSMITNTKVTPWYITRMHSQKIIPINLLKEYYNRLSELPRNPR